MVTEDRRQASSVRFSLQEDGKEVARAWLYLIQNDLHEEPYGLLEDVFVDESARGKGHAQKLIQAVIDRAKRLHCYKLVATSREERVKVHELYMKLGFQFHGYEFRMEL